MHAKKRDNRFSLYRSQYVRKGTTGNSHGYSTQEFVGSLPADALEIPDDLAAKLSPREIEYVENKVVFPARQAAEQSRRQSEDKRRAMEARECDPRWRVEDALRLLTEAESLVAKPGARIDAVRVKSLYKTLDILAASANARPDPLDTVVAAVVSATAAVKSGHYGNGPSDNVRDSREYKNWQRIRELVDSGPDSLLKALQAKGWVTVRR